MNNYKNMKVTDIKIFESDINQLEYQNPLRAKSIVP